MARRLSVALAAAGALALLAQAAASAGALPKLLGSSATGRGTALLVRPAEIDYTGDSSGELGGFGGSGKNGDYGRLRWSSWEPQQALGSGAVWIDSCIPNCAAGAFSPHPVKLRAFRPRGGVFTRLTLVYRDAGKTVVDPRALIRQGGNWIYAVVSP